MMAGQLHERLSELYRAGMARELLKLHLDPRVAPDMPMKPAAVLVAMTESARPDVLLIRRPVSMRAHPGQVAFPGGRQEPGEDAIAAALREAQEELGLDPADVRVIGPLDHYRTATGYEVTPVLATIPPGLTLTPSDDEVAEWFAPPASHVLAPEHLALKPFTWQGAVHRIVDFEWHGRRIWGVTGAILANLAARLDWDGRVD